MEEGRGEYCKEEEEGSEERGGGVERGGTAEGERE